MKHRHQHRPRLRGPLAALALLFAGWAHPMAAAEVTHFKVGISEPVNTVLALWMAQAAGLYSANGLDVEIISINAGSRRAQELPSGRIKPIHFALSPLINLNQ